MVYNVVCTLYFYKIHLTLVFLKHVMIINVIKLALKINIAFKN